MKIAQVAPPSPEFAALLGLAEALKQARYVLVNYPHVLETHFLGAFDGPRCMGFLRLDFLVIGSDVNRPPIPLGGQPLREGFVEAFGVDPAYRRQGIGQAMQERAIAVSRQKGCYQIRSRSPVYAVENYALKLKMGYAVQPSEASDSYYFIKTLR